MDFLREKFIINGRIQVMQTRGAKKEHKAMRKELACKEVARLFPEGLLDHLATLHQKLPGEVFISGGTVRDLLLGRKPSDIDLTVVHHARQWADQLATVTGGTYVSLGRQEDAARVVWQGEDVDFSSFREGASSIEEELHKRDITVNSMALPVHELFHDPLCANHTSLPIIDPTGGRRDLAEQIIRVTSSSSFAADPLRMLRVFRFAAILDCSVDPAAMEQIHLHRQEMERISKERIRYELDLIMASDRACTALAGLRQCGLLWEILPELRAGVGMGQPASHHLDVFEHSLEALCQMEEILAEPGRFFPENSAAMHSYLQTGRYHRLLKWAALFHDIGKPATYGINEDKGGRITFYDHDQQGADIFSSIAHRLRWSSEDTRLVARLISGHMRPFFLANNQRQGNLTLKACLRLVKAIDKELPGLFLLSMADALAGKGEGSPDAMEEEVSALFNRLREVEANHVKPVRTAQPLITGQDLINELNLKPGPHFRIILEEVEEAQMELKISTRGQALSLAESLAEKLAKKLA